MCFLTIGLALGWWPCIVRFIICAWTLTDRIMKRLWHFNIKKVCFPIRNNFSFPSAQSSEPNVFVRNKRCKSDDDYYTIRRSTGADGLEWMATGGIHPNWTRFIIITIDPVDEPFPRLSPFLGWRHTRDGDNNGADKKQSPLPRTTTLHHHHWALNYHIIR